MQISKKIPFDDPNVLNGVRALYIVSNLIIASIYLYVQNKINQKNGMQLVPGDWKRIRRLCMVYFADQIQT